MSDRNRFMHVGRPLVTHWLVGPGPDAVPFKLQGPAAPDPRRTPVLITHGLSAAANTAQTNVGATDASGTLVGHLEGLGADVWLLDWRGSCDAALIARQAQHLDGLPEAAWRAPYRFNLVAQQDLAPAASFVAQRYPQPVRLLAHCMGAAAACMALAGAAPGLAEVIDRAVLSTVGLFFEPDQLRQVLADDHVVAHNRDALGHRIPTLAAQCNPDTWGPLEGLYEMWHDLGAGPLRVNRLPEAPADFRRQAFLYGEPFDPDLLAALYPQPDAPGVRGLFGDISVDLLGDAATFVRAGVALQPDEATPWTAAPGAIDGFARLEQITLVTGRHNRLWHRRSIDQMAEWLWRELPDRGARVTKHVLANYAHQDLFWGPKAPKDTFGLMAEALGLTR